jgi:hypothetical protein
MVSKIDAAPGAELGPSMTQEEFIADLENWFMIGYSGYWDPKTGEGHYAPAKYFPSIGNDNSQPTTGGSGDEARSVAGDTGVSGGGASALGAQTPGAGTGIAVAQATLAIAGLVPGPVGVVANLASAVLTAYQGHPLMAAIIAGGAILPGIAGIAGRIAADGASEAAAVGAAESLASSAGVAAEGAVASAGERVGGTIQTSLVRFTQSSVRRTLRNGEDINDVVEALNGAGGDQLARSFEPIRIFEREGNLFTLDNRRLVIFNQAGRDVPYVWATPEEGLSESWKFTATPEQANGWFIRVK